MISRTPLAARPHLTVDWCCARRTLAPLVWMALCAAAAVTANAQSIAPGCRAEWDRPSDILVHTPDDELFYGIIHPDAALFERPFSSLEAVAEHREWIDRLRRHGVRVHTVRDALLDATVDPASGERLPGPALDRLRALARSALEVSCEGFPDRQREQDLQAKYLDEVLYQLDPRDLWRIVLLRPHVRLRSTDSRNTGYQATYEVRPVMNLYFTRDQLITTRRGVVVGRMNSEQRRIETEIVRTALDALGIVPIYEVQEPGRLEGGDFLPAGERVFLGEGLRTNANAVRQLLDRDVFGSAEVVVVKDTWQNQQQMHLDTYFNIVGPRHVLMVDTRLSAGADGRPRERSAEMTLKADVYRQRAGKYRLELQDVDFETYLRSGLQLTIIPVSAADQARYGVNVLTVGAGSVMGVEGVSDDFKRRLKQAGIDAEWVDFSALTGGYGACHCTTQVLRRQ